MRDRGRHGRRWSVWYPFRWVCRCGLESYPCHVERMLARAELGDAERLYADGLAYARTWQMEQRRRWRGAR